MFCTFQFFLDKHPSDSIQEALHIMEMIRARLSLSFNWLEYSIHDLEQKNCYHRETEPWDQNSSFFTESIKQIMDIYKEENEEVSFWLRANDDIPEDFFWFEKNKLAVQFPVADLPMTIRVFYKISKDDDINIDAYKDLICQLDTQGFHVNNSFFHISLKMNELCSLQGENEGFFKSSLEKEMENSYSNHCAVNCKDHIMNIFYGNSICCKCIDDTTAKKIEDIVGRDNISVIEDSLVFFLPEKRGAAYEYRKRNRNIIATLRQLL